MNHHIRRTRDRATLITRHVKVTRKGIENLSRIREVGLQCVDIGSWIWEGDKI